MKTYLRTDNQKKRIVKIEFVRDMDDSPDLSHLGEYSCSPGDDDKTVDRQEQGDMMRGEMRYFIAAMSGKETGNPESVMQDYRRMETYGDTWHMTFCHCLATISINGIMQTVTSGGLGGVESDSGDDYFKEIRKEQEQELADVLKDMGFTPAAIRKAMKNAE